MISKFAVERFMSRQLASFNWMKKLPRTELLAAVNQLDPKPKFTGPFKPYKHQLVGFLIGVYVPEFLYFLDLGVGKTRVALDLIAYDKLRGESPRALVLVPNAANIENWIIEAETHTPSLRCVPLIGSSSERFQALRRTGDVFIINYAGFAALCTVLEKQGGGKRKRRLDKERFRSAVQDFSSITLDESTAILNKHSLITRICNQAAAAIPRRYALTGTPFGRDPQALWSQFYFIDRGATLGPTLGMFREAFFTKKKNYWGGFEYKFIPKLKGKLHRVLQNRSIFYHESECVDLPPRVDLRRTVSFTSEMEAYYNKIKEQLIAAKGNYRLVQNAFLNMRQISSGFIGLVDDKTGARAQLEFPTNPKLDDLLEAVRGLPDGAKFVVFHEYVWSGEKISRALTKLGVRHERLWGGQKDPAGALRRFREYPDIPGFVVNNQSGAFGLNLQVANYALYFESPVRPIVRTQTEKRLRRPGQKARRVFNIDLVMKGTYDERILDYLAEGRDLFDAIVAGKEMP